MTDATTTVPTTEPATAALDLHDVRRAQSAPGILRVFNDAAVLGAADVQVARRLGGLSGIEDDPVLLGVALAVRAPRLGHVCIDLATAPTAVTADIDTPIDVQSLPWPDIGDWLAALTASPLVATGAEAPADRPLRLDGTRLYLDRYWGQERQIAADLVGRTGVAPGDVDVDLLRAGLDRLFGTAATTGAPDLQRLASAVAVLRRFTVVAGGPGTGKTTTVARILALLDEQWMARGGGIPRIALAAPTGKAAARLQEAVHDSSATLDVSDETHARLLGLNASTLHRLLGWRPDSHSRFRHHRGNRLPHDVVLVDEASMVSLSLMAKLVESVRADARLILVGDPDQLASVEAGAVLGDVVGPAARQLRMTPGWRAEVEAVCNQPVVADDSPADVTIGNGIVVLHRVHRYGGGIAKLAEAVQCGDADAALAVLGTGLDDVEWIDADLAEASSPALLVPVRRRLVAAGRTVVDAARAGDAAGALAGLGAMRVLCAHRRGPYGVAAWMPTVERWLTTAIEGYGAGGRWYVGRPLLVSENDYGLQLYNGDTGVVVATGGGPPGRVRAAFERRGEVVLVSPTRLAAVESVHAMTVHKSQGSQFGTVAVFLPDPTSPVLSRELLYTAITRAREHLIVAGPEASIRAAIETPIARASGLRDALWTGPAALPAGVHPAQ